MQVLSYNEAAARAGIVRRTLERLISIGEGARDDRAFRSSPWRSRSRPRGLAAQAPAACARGGQLDRWFPKDARGTAPAPETRPPH